MATMVTGLGGPAGYGENVFSTTPKTSGNNDDGAVAVNISSVFSGGLDFYGTNYTTLYVNSNGVLSFGGPQTGYAPNLAGSPTPLIAPFWSDVNINSAGEIYWDLDPAAGTVTITWDGVAPYSGGGTNSFQVVLTDQGGGDFSVDFIYENISWTNGGFGTAQTGFTDGGANDTFLEGSGNGSVLAGYETNDFDGGDPLGAYQVVFENGTPAAANFIVEGGSGDDLIDATYGGDPGGDAIDAYDYSDGSNRDSVEAGAGNDTVIGGHGDDTLLGEDGNDLIYGGYGGTTPLAYQEDLNWSLQGGDGTSVAAGFTQTTGQMEVSVSFANTGNNNPTFTIETSDTLYVDGGETFDTNSSLFLFGQGDAATSTTTIDFAATTGADVSDEVENVAFRINDIDWGNNNHTDIVTVNAYDANGVPVTVTLTPGGGDTVSGNTITAEQVAESSASQGGSVLVEIAGPVQQIEIIYENGQFNTQGINVTDIEFDLIPQASDDDSIEAGGGADTVFGEDGSDTLGGGDGNDSLDGGDGADSIDGDGGDDTISGGSGDDTLDGGTGSDTLYGGDGDDILREGSTGGLTGALYGEAGNDTLYSGTGTGADLLDGGEDDDLLIDQGSSGGQTTLLGGAGNDTLQGGPGNDSLEGGTGADDVSAGAGNDTILASHNDTVDGEAGDDFIRLVDLGELAGGTIFVEGGTTGQTSGDVLDLNGLADRSTLNITSNVGGEQTGTVQMYDGTLVSFSNIDDVICFTPGTRILTETGYRPIETLALGDRIITRDDGPQPLRWVGTRQVLARGKTAPIRIAPHVLGGSRPLLVSPQHRMLFEGYRAELLFGAGEVFAAARHLVDGQDVRVEEGGMVTYIHLMLDRHQVIYAEGMATESFHVGDQGLRALHPAARADLFARFPDLQADPTRFGDTARPCLKAFEARALVGAGSEALALAA